MLEGCLFLILLFALSDVARHIDHLTHVLIVGIPLQTRRYLRILLTLH